MLGFSAALIIVLVLFTVSNWQVAGQEVGDYWLSRQSPGVCVAADAVSVADSWMVSCLQQCLATKCHSLSLTPANECLLGYTDQMTVCASSETITYRTHDIFAPTTTTTTTTTTTMSTTTTTTTTTTATPTITTTMAVPPEPTITTTTTAVPPEPTKLTLSVHSSSTKAAGAGAAEETIDGVNGQNAEGEAFCSNMAGSEIIYDLGASYTIAKIDIYTMQDSTTATNIELLVGDDASSLADICYYRDGDPASVFETFECTAIMTGRYVKLHWKISGGSQHNCLEEIEIWSVIE